MNILNTFTSIQIVNKSFKIGSTLKCRNASFQAHFGHAGLGISWTYSGTKHSWMLSPLAPDPIRVHSCVCCLFWANRNSIDGNIYFSIYLIIQLEIWIHQSLLSVNRNIYFYWNYSVWGHTGLGTAEHLREH